MLNRQRITSVITVAMSALLFVALPSTAQSSTSSTPAADKQARVIELNNDGVKALTRKDYQESIRDFEEALRLDPNYSLAKENVAIAHNNLGLQLKEQKHFAEALKEFHAAVYANEKNNTASHNLDDTIKCLGLDPNKSDDRIKLGDSARADGDLVGTLVEYEAVARLRGDYVPAAGTSEVGGKIVDQTKPDEVAVDFGPYMADLQRTIKMHWYPPKHPSRLVAIVQFSIHKNGDISDLHLDRTSGFAIMDDSAMEAVKHSSPLRPLPAGTQDVVHIQFTFDYTAFASGGRAPGTSTGSANSSFNIFSIGTPGVPAAGDVLADQMDRWARDLQQRVKSAWEPKHAASTATSIICFNVHSDGTISNVRVTKPSGVASNDDAAMAAVKSAAPFLHIPLGAPSDLTIEFAFNDHLFHFPLYGIPGVRVKNAKTGAAVRTAVATF